MGCIPLVKASITGGIFDYGIPLGLGDNVSTLVVLVTNYHPYDVWVVNLVEHIELPMEVVDIFHPQLVHQLALQWMHSWTLS